MKIEIKWPLNYVVLGRYMSLLHFKVSKEVENYTTHTKIDLDFFKTKVMFFVTLFFFGKKYKQTNIQANKRHLRIKKKYKDPPPRKKNQTNKQNSYFITIDSPVMPLNLSKYCYLNNMSKQQEFDYRGTILLVYKNNCVVFGNKNADDLFWNSKCCFQEN